MPRKTKEELEKDNKKTNIKKTTSAEPKAKSKISEKTKKTELVSDVSKKTKTSNAKATSKTSDKSKIKPKATPKSSEKAKVKVAATRKKSPTTSNKRTKTTDIIEYYDLPYRYNKTIVKILAQTPKTLFVYWDISDKDRENYILQYGKDFFNNTKPILIVHNKTKNYSFEIELNDFANSWYFAVNDEKCEYIVELGRRPKDEKNIYIPNNYIYITSSNTVESPNNHILFEKDQKTVYFRNVVTNVEYSKDTANLNFLRYMGKIYNIYEMYHKIYNDNEVLDINNISHNNPTSF